MASSDHPARAARAAASTCQPAAAESVFVSTTVTCASGTMAAPLSAAFTVPLRPEDMCTERISRSTLASRRYSAAKTPGAG